MHALTPSLRDNPSAPCAGYVSWTMSVFPCQWSSPRRYETVITVASPGEPDASATGGSRWRAGSVSDRRPAVSKRS
jgi:hypothetical protein